MDREGLDQSAREGNGTALVRLRVPTQLDSADDRVRPGHGQPAPKEVHVADSQRRDLTPPQACEARKADKSALGATGKRQGLQLAVREVAMLLAALRRWQVARLAG